MSCWGFPQIAVLSVISINRFERNVNSSVLNICDMFFLVIIDLL